MSDPQDTGDIAEVDVVDREDVDRPDLDADGGDDTQVPAMLDAAYAYPGEVVPEEALL